MVFQSAIKTQALTKPYQGTGPDLLGAQVDFICAQTNNTTSQIQGATIKGYATTKERLAIFPDIPNAKDSDLPAMDVGIWHGIHAPKGSETTATGRLSNPLQVTLADEGMIKAMADLGAAPASADEAAPAALKSKCEAEVEK